MENKIRKAFDALSADRQLKETTKVFLSQKRKKKTIFIYHPAFQRILAAACAALFLTAGAGGYLWLQTPVSYVSIDVNPSIELALNWFDRVISVKAYNSEGEEILEDLSLKGKKYTDAIDAVVESQGMGAYLTEEAEVVLTVASDTDRETELQSGVEGCCGQIGNNSQSVSVGMEIAEQAHENDVSVGKYYAWQQLAEYDSSMTLDQCRHMSISEIHGLTREHEQGHGQGHRERTGQGENSGSHHQGEHHE